MSQKENKNQLIDKESGKREQTMFGCIQSRKMTESIMLRDDAIRMQGGRLLQAIQA